MKVIVTGATGFIGRHVVPALLAREHEVLAVVRDVQSARQFEWFDRVKAVSYDIHRCEDTGHEVFAGQDATIHLAWAGLPNYKAAFHIEENLPAHCRFMKLLLQSGVGQLLVTGTCLEYGLKDGCLTEEMPPEPENAYALAKDSLRKYIEALKTRHAFTFQWARLFYMYGPGQNPNSLIAQLDRAIDNAEPTFKMSGGEQLRDYLPVQEVARRLVQLLEHPDCQGLVNVCSGAPVSVRDMVEHHVARRGAAIDLELGHYPYPDYEPMAFWGKAEKYWGHCKDV